MHDTCESNDQLRDLKNIAAGQTVVYYRGSSYASKAPEPIRNLTKTMFAEGLIFLMQRRAEDGQIEYIAVGRHVIRPSDALKPRNK